MSEGRAAVAFADISNLGWTAGAHYYKNLFVAMRTLDEERRPRIIVVVAPRRGAVRYDDYRTLADEVVELPAPRRTGFVGRQVIRLRAAVGRPTGRAPAMEALLRAHGADALFACWMELGPDFGVPTLGWIPDYQHRHFPEVFTDDENRERDELFDRMAANCTRIVLSSEDARGDFARFHPAHLEKARVLRFVAHVDASVYETDPAEVAREYHLPERFVYLPNQFWVHKNHSVVVEALALLRARNSEVTVVCTGNPADNRDPLHYARLLAEVSRRGVRDRFVVLGWVPHAHTYALMRRALTVLQPSRFEGWSTTVEEAKSVGAPVVLSDIPVHREQDPPASAYFDPSDPEALADRLAEVDASRCPGPDAALEEQARAALPGRTRAYAEAFLEIVRDATGRSR